MSEVPKFYQLLRSHEEIEEKLDELGYLDYCSAQSGAENMAGTAKLKMLNWLLGTNYNHDSLYRRGEALYNNGIRLEWDNNQKKYVKVKYNREVIRR